MSNHQKRLSVPKSWPVERKTETFTVKAQGPHGEDGVPLLIVLRDVLGYVASRKEARYALEQGTVLVNGDANVAEDRPIGMFDILAFTERDEYYRVFPGEGGRLALTEIDAADADSKLSKIEDKTKVAGGRTQLNLHDGQNLLVEDSVAPPEQRDGDGVPVDASEYAAKDSIVIDNDDGEIVAHFPYEEGSLVTAVRGSHAGDVGEIAEIQITPGSGSNNVVVEPVGESQQNEGDDTFETVEEYVVVIDENFTGDDADGGDGE